MVAWGPGIKTGMNVHVNDPKSLGADILADCAGASYEYGGPVLVAISAPPPRSHT